MNDKQATPEREPGFYWVKWRTDESEAPEPAEYIGNGDWWRVGSPNRWPTSSTIEIGERIERQTPDGGTELVFYKGVRAKSKVTNEIETVLQVDWVNRVVYVLPERNLEGGDQEAWRFEEIELLPPPPQRVETNNDLTT